MVGFAGAVVMAVVRTDEGVGVLTWYARVHMVGAVAALVFLPLGILFALRFADRRTWRLGVGLPVAAGVVGALVLVSTGVDTVGSAGLVLGNVAGHARRHRHAAGYLARGDRRPTDGPDAGCRGQRLAWRLERAPLTPEHNC